MCALISDPWKVKASVQRKIVIFEFWQKSAYFWYFWTPKVDFPWCFCQKQCFFIFCPFPLCFWKKTRISQNFANFWSFRNLQFWHLKIWITFGQNPQGNEHEATNFWHHLRDRFWDFRCRFYSKKSSKFSLKNSLILSQNTMRPLFLTDFWVQNLLISRQKGLQNSSKKVVSSFYITL